MRTTHKSSGLNLKSLRMFLVCSIGCAAALSDAAVVQPVVTGAAPDSFVTASYSAQSYGGLVGKRMEVNALKSIMVGYSAQALLTPFKNRFNGGGDDANWSGGGEYPGKLLWASIYAWKFSGNQALKARADSLANGLISYQGVDGYLGCADLAHRWGGQGWDVWINKYCMKGLLAYYIETGDTRALNASVKCADLMCNTFGPGKQIPNIDQTSGWYGGQPSTAILESMALLYRYTGTQRYLDFCNYLVETAPVKWIRNATRTPGSFFPGTKAYEAMVNYMGLLEMYRITGNAEFLNDNVNFVACVSAKGNQVIGIPGNHDQTSSAPFNINPNEWKETDDGIAWMELNWHLFRITGNPEYAQNMELSMYNFLFGIQNPKNGSASSYSLVNGSHQTGNGNGNASLGGCCGASLVRAFAAIPDWCMAGTVKGKPAIINYFPSTFTINLPAPQPRTVNVTVATRYPEDGTVSIIVKSTPGGLFGLLLRVPDWSTNFSVRGKVGQAMSGTAGQLLEYPYIYSGGSDTLTVTMDLPVRVITDPNLGSTLKGIIRGPQFLSLDPAVSSSTLPSGWVGTQLYTYTVNQGGTTKTWNMVPYCDAGQTGSSPNTLIAAFSLDGATSVSKPFNQIHTLYRKSGAAPSVEWLSVDGRLSAFKRPANGLYLVKQNVSGVTRKIIVNK